MSYITLSKTNYFHNLELLSDKLGAKEKLAVVLKDNAYGHGLMQMATLASEFGITKVIVKNYDEARVIKDLFDFILILAPNIQEITTEFSLVINSVEMLSHIPKGAKVHLKIDSGMHRNGIAQEELEEAFIMIAEKGLILEGVMTHFRSADALSTELFWQMKVWKKIKEKALVLAEKHRFAKPLFHSANSATLLRLQHYHDDFARCGIATYGYEEFDAVFGAFHLRSVLQLWGEKITSRNLKKGERVGYGGVGELSCDATVSTYDIGYGDGIFRYRGEGDLKTAEGLKIIGRISMDNLSVEGNRDKISLFADAKALAHYHDTIVYDVLVKLSPTIKRIIVG